MELASLIQQQIERDRRRGFPVDFDQDSDRIDQLMRDLVGLMGEIGEFANLLKKVGLGEATPGYVGPSLTDAGDELREELADAVIYLFRIATILGSNLEQDILRKISINDKRYGELGG